MILEQSAVTPASRTNSPAACRLKIISRTLVNTVMTLPARRRSQVLPHKGGGRLSEGHDGKIDGQLHPEIGSKGRHGIGAQSVDEILCHYVGQGDHQGLESGGDPHSQDGSQDGAVDADLTDPDPQIRIDAPEQIDHRQQCGHPLGKERRPGDAFHAEMKHQEEHSVHDHIDDASRQLEHQGHEGIPHGPDDAGSHVVADDEQSAEEIDPQIGHGQ